VGVVGLAAGRRPRNEHVEVELADELEALEVALTIACREHGGDPLAPVEVDGVVREEEAVLAAVPEVGGVRSRK
jgi:hypothetical protein